MDNRSDISENNINILEKDRNHIDSNQKKKNPSENPSSLSNDKLENEEKVSGIQNANKRISSKLIKDSTPIKEEKEKFEKIENGNTETGKPIKSILKTPEKTSSKKKKEVLFKDKVEGKDIAEVKEVESYKAFNFNRTEVVPNSCC